MTAQLLFVFATPMEATAALAPCGLPDIGPPPRQGDIFSAVLLGRQVDVLITGIGPINAAMHTGRAIERLQPTGVINLGIAGSYDIASLPMGSTTIATRECWPEFGLRTSKGIDPKGIGFSLGLQQGEEVHDQLALAPETDAPMMNVGIDSNWVRTTEVTVSAVSATPDLAHLLATRYKAETENMEGFSVAWAAICANANFLEVRTISNLAGSREKRHWNIKLALGELGTAMRCLLRG